MKAFLAETLKFQNTFGVDLSFDFISGRTYGNAFKANDTEKTTNSINKITTTIQTEQQPQTQQQEEKNLKQNLNETQEANIGKDNEKNIENIEKETKKEITNDEIMSIKTSLKDVKTFEELCEKIKSFNGCDLKRTATNDVIFDGNPNAKVILIGEAPGETEDAEGKPFCGQSGKLLRKALSFIGLNEQTMLITNCVFWRPPLNRKPDTGEIQSCLPFVEKMIEIVKPEYIILCGATAIETILKTKGKISSITGTMQEAKIDDNTIKTFPIYHPSYLLRVPSQKKIFWEHLLKIKKAMCQTD